VLVITRDLKQARISKFAMNEFTGTTISPMHATPAES
jgi:hypothetical protein